MPIRRMIKHWWRNSLVEEEHNLQFQEKNGRILTHCYTEAKKGFTGCTSCPQQRYTFSMKYSKYLSETVSKWSSKRVDSYVVIKHCILESKPQNSNVSSDWDLKSSVCSHIFHLYITISRIVFWSWQSFLFLWVVCLVMGSFWFCFRLFFF